MRNALSLWLVTSRPLLYPLVPIIILFGYFAAGGTVMALSPAALLLLVMFTFPFSLIVYGLNDIHDAHSDAVNAHRHWLTGGVASEDKHHIILVGVALAMVAILAVIIGIGSQLLGFMVSLALLFAYFYSVPPLRLKAVPVLDCMVSGVGYVLIPFLIGAALQGQVLLLPEVMVMSVFVAMYHMLCSVRDYEADRRVGDTTTVVWLGPRTSLMIVVMSTILCAAVWYLLRPYDWLGFLFILALTSAALLVLYRPIFIRIAVNAMVPIAAFVAFYKLLF